MPKYSVDDSATTDSGSTCELCGTDAQSLQTVTVAGANLSVCDDCNTHNDSTTNSQTRTDKSPDARDSQREDVLAEDGSAMHHDSEHWEANGVDYNSDQLPRLRDDYATRVQEARRAAGLTEQELANELGVDVEDIVTIEGGRAAVSDRINKSTIADLEARLEISVVHTPD